MLLLSSQALTGWFTLGAAVSVAIVTGVFNWLGRKADRLAVREQREADAKDRRDDRHAADMAQWRDSAADVPGQVREFMTDVHPYRVTMNIQRGTEQEIMQKLTAKWKLIRQPFARLAIGLPSVHARELADEVVSGLHRTLNMVGWTLSEMAAQRPFTDALSRATKEWDQLNENVKELREAIHESS